jgi:hypothetical protein
MKHATHVKPVDVYAMWGMPGLAFEDAGEACRAWLDGAQRMQVEAVDFFNDRIGKDMAMLSAWGRCATPTEALDLQARYSSDALTEYLAEGRRMFALLGDRTPRA